MSTIAPPVNVDSVLTPPVPAGLMEQALESVQSQGALGLGQISAVIGMLVGFDPLQEWVYKPFIGDWGSMELAAEAWPRCGEAVQLINERVGELGSFVGDGWQGKAAFEFGECHAKLGQLLAPLPQQCEQAGVMDQQLAIFAKGIVAFIGEVIQSLVQFGLDILSMIWVPVVGEINVGKVLAIAIPMIIGWTIEITNLFNEFLGFMDAVHAIHTGIVGMLGPVRQSLSMLTTAASIGLEIYNIVSEAKPSGSSGSAPQG
ncbi:hypothetical protein G7066_13555 [Leucobacter coleopterorum]|uniref:Proteins of 100 residues with WXG n=1 Tax=Leucobacter coleopterorum TaxID=2714933 RepID=A0ABX6K251_9MICO|nr:hypothetical protein [Leucobacter coleopterorum]QIM19342.1 hypothetical protein G7066_13555 [Leucobacter coleopterorum]